MRAADEKRLGAYLKDRRAKLDPAAFGLPLRRRRTPGLRREEVAQRANVSATWYTWLEQGRGGAPSADVLDRIARALMLTDVEREHLFLLGLGRPPEVRYQGADGVSSRIIFCDPRNRARQPHWEEVARFVVAAFRADAARAGASDKVKTLVDELSAASPDFAAMWREHDVRNYGEGTKYLKHPRAGMIGLEYSSFAVDGRPDLGLVIYSPATPADAKRIRSLIGRATSAST